MTDLKTPGDHVLAAVEARLASLPVPPMPATFDDNLRAALRLRAAARRWRRWSIAAAFAALVTGLSAGALWARRAEGPVAPPDGRAEFMLIFDEQVAGRISLDAAARRVRSEEMNAWVAVLRAGRHVVSGRKLRDEAGQRATPQGLDDRRGQVPPGTMISGFMIIRAVDYAEASRLAQTSPIVAHGGSIAVRAVQ